MFHIIVSLGKHGLREQECASITVQYGNGFFCIEKTNITFLLMVAGLQFRLLIILQILSIISEIFIHDYLFGMFYAAKYFIKYM